MRLASLLLASMVALAPAGAAAGGYVSAGVGSSPSLGGELTHLSSEGSRSGRVSLGHGFGPIALEAGLGGFGVAGAMPGGDYVDGTVLTAGVSVKALAEMVPRLSAYAR